MSKRRERRGSGRLDEWLVWLQGTPPDRRAASAALQKVGDIRSYGPLLESLQTAADEQTVIAILRALAAVGHRCVDDETVEDGFTALKKLIEDNLDNPAMVEEALEAFVWTGTIELISDVLVDLMGRAPEETSIVLSDCLLRLLVAH